MGVKNRLLEIRLKLGYKKQKDFAEFLEVSQVSYNKWENNSSQPSLEMLFKIRNKLKSELEDIVYVEDSD